MMYSLAQLRSRDDRPVGDQIVVLDRLTWEDYERLLAARGDKSAPRLAYLKGLLEIMSPSEDHETIKSRIGHLVEAYCLHRGVDFEAVGSWTLKERTEERGVEPDECYLIGERHRERPHLAIEVEWTSGGIDKLEIYRKLDVPEVWWWRRGRIRVFVLRGEQYEEREGSEILPELDLELLCSFLDRPWASTAIREFREALAQDDA